MSNSPSDQAVKSDPTALGIAQRLRSASRVGSSSAPSSALSSSSHRATSTTKPARKKRKADFLEEEVHHGEDDLTLASIIFLPNVANRKSKTMPDQIVCPTPTGSEMGLYESCGLVAMEFNGQPIAIKPSMDHSQFSSIITTLFGPALNYIKTQLPPALSHQPWVWLQKHGKNLEQNLVHGMDGGHVIRVCKPPAKKAKDSGILYIASPVLIAPEIWRAWTPQTMRPEPPSASLENLPHDALVPGPSTAPRMQAEAPVHHEQPPMKRPRLETTPQPSQRLHPELSIRSASAPSNIPAMPKVLVTCPTLISDGNPPPIPPRPRSLSPAVVAGPSRQSPLSQLPHAHQSPAALSPSPISFSAEELMEMDQDPDAGVDSTDLTYTPAQPAPAVLLPSTKATAPAPAPANQPEQLMHTQYASPFYNVYSIVRARYQDWDQEYDFWAFALDDSKRAARRFAYPGGYWIKPTNGADGIRAGSKLGYYSRD
ncbi:hypothetical protein M407DRAFT_29150 [Tulasnella calospora MUT 4182]|uniref:Uncharacterized protein n=1 Tax=Tulasnella calospora MUT 4182 TaxID=1051891 RepID=A0A0C3LIH0_9AGAM|nr:hypothetical protein M407DRAFT_29150 [Tulasnella calospora MUT 4182]